MNLSLWPRCGAAHLGMRRVAWVRITVERSQVRAEVVGVGHRIPVTRSVPLHVAADLAAAGTPTVVRRLGGPGQPAGRV